MPVLLRKTAHRFLGKVWPRPAAAGSPVRRPSPPREPTMHRSASPRDGRPVATDRNPAAAVIPTVPIPRPTPRWSLPGPIHTDQVLVVDDEPGVLSTLANLLESAGYGVRCASDLRAALAALHSDTFQLVLSDLYLGSDLAYDLAEAADAQRPRVPVVLLTGRPSFHGAAEALRTRVAEIVAKPIDPDLLVTTCRSEEHTS